jgi:hypothetical protein
MNAYIVAEAVSKAPEHEILTCAMGLQVIEWAIKVTSKKDLPAEARLIGNDA